MSAMAVILRLHSHPPRRKGDNVYRVEIFDSRGSKIYSATTIEPMEFIRTRKGDRAEIFINGQTVGCVVYNWITDHNCSGSWVSAIPFKR